MEIIESSLSRLSPEHNDTPGPDGVGCHSRTWMCIQNCTHNWLPLLCPSFNGA